ncbi:hypothetical protein EDD86DRAFT_278737 [Gorgonomyces haynaldii]|nr:hypothetical protein EDD86DRAFT_278737 [Gorgonomyces haynaldii]
MITTLPNEVISIITAHLDMRSFYRLWRTSKHLSLVLNFEAPVDTLLNRAPLVVQTKYHWRPRGPVTPKQLNTAIERGLCRLLDRLLSKGWIDSAEVLLTAIQFKQLEVVELLYHYHPNLDPSGYRGGPLHWACHVNALEICEPWITVGCKR